MSDTPQKIVDDVVRVMQRRQAAFERSSDEYMNLKDNSASEAECQECKDELAKAPARIQALIDARAALLEEAVAALKGLLDRLHAKDMMMTWYRTGCGVPVSEKALKVIDATAGVAEQAKALLARVREKGG